MLADAASRKFDVLICESIDRLGRNLSDVADLFDRLSFYRIPIYLPKAGLVTRCMWP